jgi:putative endonuclease
VSTVDRGRRGEERAAAFLRDEGYEILEKNFRSRRGEVDIVAVRDDVVAFVEVKSWSSWSAAELEYAIGMSKQRRIRRTAEIYLQGRRDLHGHHLRFDVVFVSAPHGAIEHLTDVF